MNQNIIQIAQGRESCKKKTEQWMIDGVPQLIRDAGANMGSIPHVIVLACRWRYFAAEDLEGLKKLALNMDYRIVRIPCSGQVQENWIETALDSGAGAVMVIGGHLATCAYTQDANGREKEPNTEMGSSGIDSSRLVVDWSEGDTVRKILRISGPARSDSEKMNCPSF